VPITERLIAGMPVTALRSASINAARCSGDSVDFGRNRTTWEITISDLGTRISDSFGRYSSRFFPPLASQRLRMFCLNCVHFAFFASLYFCFGSRCSPPGRHLLSFFGSMPSDFL
jgi:hypothetical protein